MTVFNGRPQPIEIRVNSLVALGLAVYSHLFAIMNPTARYRALERSGSEPYHPQGVQTPR